MCPSTCARARTSPLSASEVRVQFRSTPHVLYTAQCGPRLDSNAITIRLQPDEGISLRFNGKVPGTSMQLRPVRMHFSYDSEFGAYTPEAYERLLLEAIAGDATLFIRRDEVETAWGIVDPIRDAWEGEPLKGKEFYPAGTLGAGGLRRTPRPTRPRLAPSATAEVVLQRPNKLRMDANKRESGKVGTVAPLLRLASEGRQRGPWTNQDTLRITFPAEPTTTLGGAHPACAGRPTVDNGFVSIRVHSRFQFPNAQR